MVDTAVDIGAAPIDIDALEAYLRRRFDDLDGEFSLLRFPAGHSNLTYLAQIGQRALVIKCSPPGNKAVAAHDMGREFGMLSRIQAAYPFAPRAYDYSDDPSVIGLHFFTMDRLRGVIIRSEFPEEARANPRLVPNVFTGLLDGLAALHQIDVDAVGLSDFGRPEGYRERQVQGWIKRMEAARTDDAPDFAPIASWLQQHLPRGPHAKAVVHNDFKLDNLVWREGRIDELIGVLDWEMSTIGDPLMDLACTLSFWVQEDDPAEFRALRAMPTTWPGVLSREGAINYYAARTGSRLDPAEFFLCFGLFRRAVIEQQKYARFVRGQSDDPRYANLQGAVHTLRAMCLSAMA